MPFIMQCDNRKCLKSQSPLLDIATNKVYCEECNGEITNITNMAKQQLKNFNQTTSNKQTTESYSIVCNQCKHKGTPKLINKELVCVKCNTKSVISVIVGNLIKEYLKNV